MRKVLAALLLASNFLCATSLGAQASAAPETTYSSVLGVAPGAASQFAGTFASSLQSVASMFVLGVIPAPMLIGPHLTHRDHLPHPRLPLHEKEQKTPTSVSPGVPIDMGPVPTPQSLMNGAKDPKAMRSTIPQRPVLGRLGAAPAPSAARMAQSIVNAAAASTTGAKSWWAFSNGAVPGVGSYSVNVASGNMLLESSDVHVPERGLNLDFKRFYNSQSKFDYNGTDGSGISQYGDGWSNTYSAHLAWNSGNPACPGVQGISVFTADGAEYRYCPDGNGNWVAPAGLHATLSVHGPVGNQAYSWTLSDGTIYYFWSPDMPSNLAAYAGRLSIIWARNNNNYVQLQYSWDNGDASVNRNLARIVVQHRDGHSLTLQFATFGNYKLLYSIARPDGLMVSYSYYGGTSTLYGFYGAGNDSTANPVQTYSWVLGHILASATSPRWNNSNGADGGYTNFYFTNVGAQLLHVNDCGNYNLTATQLPDGTGSALQPNVSTPTCYRWHDVTYVDSGHTDIADDAKHFTRFAFDALGRVVAMAAETGASANYLNFSQTWDQDNNITSSVDPRSQETDYAYAVVNGKNTGNLVAIAAPAATIGSFRATSIFAYDSNNNVVASCDPVYVHKVAGDWVAGQAVNTAFCNAGNHSATRYTWTQSANDSTEPFGRLTDVYTPCFDGGGCKSLGNDQQFSYPSYGSATDYGLPVSTSGSAQTPTLSMAYDSYGNVTAYDIGKGQFKTNYDVLNRPVQRIDPDAGNPTSCTSYFRNGEVSAMENAVEHAAAGGTGQCTSPGQYAQIFSYDADGNLLAHSTHFGSGGTKKMFYDAGERLVEVLEPKDAAHDAFTGTGTSTWGPAQPATPWATRYLYDLSSNGSVSIGESVYGTSTYAAHGNLFKTQKYMAGPLYDGTAIATSYAQPTWTDVAGTAYDELDRPVARYNYQPGKNLVSWTYLYDSAPGLLASETSPLGDKVTPTYDNLGRFTTVDYAVSAGSASTPKRTVSYDADGRVNEVSTSAFGKMDYSYDADGRLESSIESLGGVGISEFAASGGWNSNTTLNYSYYPDGKRAGVGIDSPLLKESKFEQDSYRADGLLSSRTYTNSGNVYNFTWTYTDAGRLTLKSDPFSSAAVSQTFDSYGRLQAYGLPEGTLTISGYDPEGEVLGYTFAGVDYKGSKVTASANFVYSNRGEMVSNGKDTFQSADGFLYKSDPKMCYSWGGQQYSSCGTQAPKFDLRMGATLGTKFTPDTYGNNPPSSMLPQDIKYDASMRMTSYTRHDSDDHLASILDDYGGGQQYAWGPNGHPIVDYGTAGSNQTNGYNGAQYLHWDGDQILYSTNASNKINDIKLGSDGDIYPLDQFQKVTMWDRDFTGVVVSAHNTTGHGSTSFTTPGSQCSEPLAVAYTDSGSFQGSSGGGCSVSSAYGGLTQPRVDGYYDGLSTINGVRSYSPGAGSWTSPDAATRNSSDPLTQMAFSYADGNPIAKMDPSGFCPPDEENHGQATDYDLLHDPTCQIGSVTSGPILTEYIRNLPTMNAGLDFMSNMIVAPLVGEEEAVGVVGYDSFRAFRAAYGSAGKGMEWHHIVGQHAANIAKFGAKAVHTESNLVRTPVEIHRLINKVYAGKDVFTHGLTVREWLSGQSFEFQYDFGMDLYRNLMGW